MSGRSWELRVQKFNSKGFEYMLLDRQYFTDISDSRVAFMTQNVSNYQHLCSCVSLFLMNHSINLIVLNYLPISKYTIRLLFKYLSFHIKYENINYIMNSFNTYHLKKMDEIMILLITIFFICILAEGR